MPKLPEVTVHVTTEPDPKEAHEFKASADLWAEQCRTLQRTLLDAQVECESLRVRLKHAQQGLGEGITRPHDGPEDCPTYYDGCNCTIEVLVHNIERAEKAEAGLAVAQARIKVLEMQAPGYAEIERARIIALIEDMMRTSCVIRDGDTGVWLVLSDLLRDICNPK